MVPMAMNLDGLVFEQAGSYNFIVEIGGAEEKRLPLRIVAHPPQLGPTD
jgi:hypothetical protein